jgi:adenosylcobinamide hydrolase
MDEPLPTSPALPELVDVGPSDGSAGQALVWRLPTAMRSISSSIVGGGLDLVGWVVNLTVDADYSRMDPAAHLAEVARRAGLQGPGIGLMTAVDVSTWASAADGGAVVCATVGVRRPVWAADPRRDLSPAPDVAGTINLVAVLPARLTDAALVNAVATVTEAKVQALLDHHVPGTGTASDAVCVLCPTEGDEDPFGGPRSLWGGRLAQATYDAVAAGLLRQRASGQP